MVRIFTPHWVPGWATLILAVLLTGGIEMFCFGIVGEYIGRIYTEIKQRPLFVVREMLELNAAAEEPKMQPVASHTMARSEFLSHRMKVARSSRGPLLAAADAPKTNGAQRRQSRVSWRS